jgi:hypothetical protein
VKTKRSLEKSWALFTQRDVDNGVDQVLLGQRRLAVLDNDEF